MRTRAGEVLHYTFCSREHHQQWFADDDVVYHQGLWVRVLHQRPVRYRVYVSATDAVVETHIDVWAELVEPDLTTSERSRIRRMVQAGGAYAAQAAELVRALRSVDDDPVSGQ